MKKIKSHFKFNKQERSGIFFLLLIIVLLQLGYFLFKSFPADGASDSLSVDTVIQGQIEVLKERALKKDSIKMYPFNPNFITDYKGYTLGMSVAEIDRLHTFRSGGSYVNTSEEFQKITAVSDSLLKVISPYFKFPEWAKSSRQYPAGSGLSTKTGPEQNRRVIEVKDLNKATAEDLKAINGIGSKLSDRIIKFRDRLGGFLVEEQLYDVYGLEAEVAERTLASFKLLSTPEVPKINLNTASVAEMVKLVYIRYSVAQEIVAYREKNGSIVSFDELRQIENFPSDKIDRIKLYLSL